MVSGRGMAAWLAGIAAVAVLAGCASGPKGPVRLEATDLELRSAQTRQLVAPSETAILSATLAVLQDMEFNVDRIEKPLGLISASKTSDADDRGEKVELFFYDLLCGGDCNMMAMAKDRQTTMLTMVVLPSLQRSSEYSVRVTLQRMILMKNGGVHSLERIEAPEVYQQVFDNLQRALALEVNNS